MIKRSIHMYGLDKDDLISLVKGAQPNYDIFDHQLIKDRGVYYDTNGWIWRTHVLEKLEPGELYDIYKLCKHSWDIK